MTTTTTTTTTTDCIAAALLSTITKTSDGDPDKPEIDGPNFFTKLQPLPPTLPDSTLSLPNELDLSAVAGQLRHAPSYASRDRMRQSLCRFGRSSLPFRNALFHRTFRPSRFYPSLVFRALLLLFLSRDTAYLPCCKLNVDI